MRRAYPRAVRSWTVLAILALGCGEAPAMPDARVVDAPQDAYVPPPPVCDELPPVAPPACGTATSDARLLAGPGDPAYDAELGEAAFDLDRGFWAFSAAFTGVNAEVRIADASRDAVTRFFTEHDGWDFEAFAGQSVLEAVERWDKVAGAYAGAGVAADAFRYATLRDQGAACDEIERARGQVIAGLDALHRAVAITGVEGVIARGYQRSDRPSAAVELVPLFDGEGNPLPVDKTNGTWRADNSGGLYPEYVWEDSCSRDMLIGWVLGMAAAWEVIARDESFDGALRERLAADALAIARSLMIVGESGYDLEIHDADGRITYNGYLNEHAVDRAYLPGRPINGQHAIMALGIVAALARISGGDDVATYLHEQLIVSRRLHELARDRVDLVDMGTSTNYSNYNMAFTGAWLAQRYLCDPGARAAVAEGTIAGLYATPGRERQPAEQKQSFYDLVYLAARGGATVSEGLDEIDDDALSRALETLREFPRAPYWEVTTENCDAAEIAAGACTGVDGTPIVLLGDVGRGDELVARDPIPMRIRPASNYHWRSDPYRPNGGGDGTRLLPAVDFRLAYWMARYLRVR